MPRVRAVVSLTCCLAWVQQAAGAQIAPADSTGLGRLRQRWINAYQAGDATAMDPLYVTGAVRLPYDAPAQDGRVAIVAAYRTSFAARAFTPTIVLQPLELSVFGARALERGAYRETLAPRRGGTPLHEEGKYVSLMERDSIGEWRYVWSIFNRDAAPRLPWR